MKSPILVYFLALGVVLVGFVVMSKNRVLQQEFRPEYFQHEFSVRFADLLPGEDRYVHTTFSLPVDTFFTEFIPGMQGDTRLLHHGVLTYEVPDSYCSKKWHSILYTVGSEFATRSALPVPYGLPVRQGKAINLELHLANKGTTTEGGLFKLLVIGEKNRRPAYQQGLGARDYCAENRDEFDIPAGVSHFERTMDRPFIMPRDGKLVAWRGHLHTYGTSLTLLRNGVEILKQLPTQNPNEAAGPDSVYLTGKIFSPPLEFKKGDVFDIRAVYDKPSELFYSGAMGNGILVIDFGGLEPVW
jgi:hypothetical protein